jgi:hypothetical protein
MSMGRYIVRSILFPYGNKLITLGIDGSTNERFGNEFARILGEVHSNIKKMI